MNTMRQHPIIRANHVARAIGLPLMVPIVFLALLAQGRSGPVLLALLVLWGVA